MKIDTKPVSIAGATADVVADAPLDLPPGVTALGVTTARVTVSIRPEVGTRSFQVGVTLRNADPATRYDLGAGQVVVTLGGPIGSLNALDGTALLASVDVGGLGDGTHLVAPDVAVPPALNVVSLSPPEVSVTVTPPSSPSPTAPAPSVAP